MHPMKFFIDTHDAHNHTVPAGITPKDFAGFYAKFEEACRAEGVVSLRAHVGFEKGRAFCLTMAPSIEAVRRAHERVGLPYDDITEVLMSTPGDIFFAREAKAA